MPSQIRLSMNLQQLLRCPACKSELRRTDEKFECLNSNCGRSFPIINGTPLLLDDSKSVFSVTDLNRVDSSQESRINKRGAKEFLRRFIPTLSKNIKARSNYNKINELMLSQLDRPRVLVIGGSVAGQGMEAILENGNIDMVETDVVFGPRTALICDAHDLPFASEVFDLVIIQAVLEHVLDPYRCCEEVFRVLKPDGWVYAETPFMQQVHGGAYDFTRFTQVGHRRLFRRFKEIDGGAVCGPGMALAWSYQHFLLSFSSSRKVRAWLNLLAKLTAFPLKYFDYYLIDKPGALDAASGYYFIGRKSQTILSDNDLLGSYRGLK